MSSDWITHPKATHYSATVPGGGGVFAGLGCSHYFSKHASLVPRHSHLAERFNVLCFLNGNIAWCRTNNELMQTYKVTDRFALVIIGIAEIYTVMQSALLHNVRSF